MNMREWKTLPQTRKDAWWLWTGLQAEMHHLFIDESLWNDADDASAAVQARIRHGAHQADIAASINKFDAALAEQPPDGFSGLPIGWPGSKTGAAKDANSLEHSQIVAGALTLRKEGPARAFSPVRPATCALRPPGSADERSLRRQPRPLLRQPAPRQPFPA